MADGVEVYKLLDDLLHIKLPKPTRARVLELNAQFKRGGIPRADEVWLRQTYNRRAPLIRELHASYENVRITEGKAQRGSARDQFLRARAKRETIRREEELREKVKAELEQFELEDKDFGF